MQEDPARVLTVGDVDAGLGRLSDGLGAAARVHHAADLTEGRDMALILNPDLIVLHAASFSSPEAGQEQCAALRRDGRTATIPILLALSPDVAEADNRTPDIAAWLRHGVTDVIALSADTSLVHAKIGLLIELHRLREDMGYAVGDPESLGLCTRAFLERSLHREVLRLRRGDGYLAVLMVQIDHFEAFAAHESDADVATCFRNVADQVTSHLRRPPDLAGRFGMDRIVCMLPETDLRGARVVAETIRDAVERRAARDQSAGEAPQTVSIGVSARRCSTPEVEIWLMQESRDRLRQACRTGHNRVVAGERSMVLGAFGEREVTVPFLSTPGATRRSPTSWDGV